MGQSVPQPHTRICGLLVPPRGQSRANTQKAHCSCFASAFVPLSDEKRDGDRSFSATPRKSQLRFAASGSHSPSKVGERASRRCDCSLPSARREPLRELVWPANFTWPGNFPDPYSAPGLPYSAHAQTHHRQRSCEPFKDSKKNRVRQRRPMSVMRTFEGFGRGRQSSTNR